MPLSRRDFLKLGGSAALGLTTASTTGQSLWAQPSAQDSATIDEIYHLVNRIAWSPRPELLSHARSIGYEAFLDEQLNPETLDDSAMDAILETMPVLGMNRQDIHNLIDQYGRPYHVLLEGTIARALHSQRQLYERVVEFWLDHFNIAGEDIAGDFVVYQREVVRRHALGNFRDLVFGTTRAPAMLTYLDNYVNEAEHPNENYARELLELHTLGVDGGYTEKDVREIARALTGWTIWDSMPDGFYFNPDTHDSGEKQILGHYMPAGRGIEDGLAVLTIVSEHPSTARFLASKLIRRFVSDTPPQSLVDSTALVWIANDGEIRPVLRHIFTSAEFRASVNQKLRRPFEFFVGALAATGTEIRNFWALYEMLQDLAQLPYGWHPPDGYPDVAGAWMNTSGLLARWNTAITLTHGAASDSSTWGLLSHLRDRVGNPQTVGALVDEIAVQVYGENILPGSARDNLIAFAADGGGADTPLTAPLMAQKYATLFGLMLAAPHFQWR